MSVRLPAPLRWVLLLLGIMAATAALTLALADLIVSPRDVWALVMFAAGVLVGTTARRRRAP